MLSQPAGVPCGSVLVTACAEWVRERIRAQVPCNGGRYPTDQLLS